MRAVARPTQKVEIANAEAARALCQRRPRAQGDDDAHARRLLVTDPQASFSTLKTFAVESSKPRGAEV
jgi:hypothetical protein